MKGFSLAMSHIIFFVATLMAVAIAVSALSVALKGLSYAMAKKTEVSANQLATYVKVVDGGYDLNGGRLWVYVKNLGQTVLDINLIDVFVNGIYVGSCATNLLCTEEDNDGLLLPDELMEITMDYNLVPGAYRIRVVTQYGVSADYEVIVG